MIKEVKVLCPIVYYNKHHDRDYFDNKEEYDILGKEGIVIKRFAEEVKVGDVLILKQINSKESEILQITDLFIGALGFKNRKIKNLNAKSEIVEYIESKYQIKMNKKTSRNEEKFNIFIWEPRK